MKSGAFENFVGGLLQKGAKMTKVETDRLNETQPDPAGLQADADAIQHVAHQVAWLFLRVPCRPLRRRPKRRLPSWPASSSSTYFCRRKLGSFRPFSPLEEPGFPPATPTSGRGNGRAACGGSRPNSRRNSVSSSGGGGGKAGGRRQNSVSAGSGPFSAGSGGGGSTVVQRIQQMAAGTGGASSGRGCWGVWEVAAEELLVALLDLAQVLALAASAIHLTLTLASWRTTLTSTSPSHGMPCQRER